MSKYISLDSLIEQLSIVRINGAHSADFMLPFVFLGLVWLLVNALKDWKSLESFLYDYIGLRKAKPDK